MKNSKCSIILRGRDSFIGAIISRMTGRISTIIRKNTEKLITTRKIYNILIKMKIKSHVVNVTNMHNKYFETNIPITTISMITMISWIK